MGWRDHIANEISKNAFLKKTTTFDGLSSYVRSEVEGLRSELLTKSKSGGSLAAVTNKDGSIDYVIPYVGGHVRGFQVKYDKEASVIVIRSVDNGSESPLLNLVSIEPHSHGAIAKYLDDHEQAGKEELICPYLLDKIFEKTLT